MRVKRVLSKFTDDKDRQVVINQAKADMLIWLEDNNITDYLPIETQIDNCQKLVIVTTRYE